MVAALVLRHPFFGGQAASKSFLEMKRRSARSAGKCSSCLCANIAVSLIFIAQERYAQETLCFGLQNKPVNFVNEPTNMGSALDCISALLV